MSRAIHSLKKRGYIKLLALPGRQRFSHLVLTDEGRSLAAIVPQTIR